MSNDTKFWDIINSEDWDENINDDFPKRGKFDVGDVPFANMLLPTPIPGVWINFSMGFDLHSPDDDDEEIF